jgi:peptide chain release factor 1
MEETMFDKLAGVENRFMELEQMLGDPNVLKDRGAFQKLSREHAELSPIVAVYRDYKQVAEDLEGSRELLKGEDPELRELAQEEVRALETKADDLKKQLRVLLIPKDPLDGKNVLIEVRAGTGGEEAGLFAADLYNMYCRYAERRGWKVESMSQSVSGIGSLKEVVALVQGQGAYSRFKYESGTHRVQRVPATEAQGRIHTSAVTVAVLPEAEDVEVEIASTEIKVDVYRSSGPGGQSVNTTDSAVRLTHLPTGLVVTCQDEKSQHKNKAKAMKVLKSRLLDQRVQEQNQERSAARKNQVGSGDRSERIRTYNFPQGRVTDHRIGLTLYKLESIMQGEIEEVLDALATHYQAQALQNESAE